MRHETGNIVEIKAEGQAVVACRPSLFCARCTILGICRRSENGRFRLVAVHNPLGARVGERVRLISPPGPFWLSVALLLVLPLAALLLGALVGKLAGAFLPLGIHHDLLAAVAGIGAMIGSIYLARFGIRAFPRATFMPEICEILPGDAYSEDNDGY